jgi:aminoglycoside phosphotransferase (APT) family kinase protein
MKVRSGQPDGDTVPGLAPEVLDWITRIAGGGQPCVTPFSHHRPMWSVDVLRPGETVELFVRGARDSGSVLASVYNLDREAAVIRALTVMGVPTPAFVGFHPDAQVLVLKRIPGRGDFYNLDRGEQHDRVARRFVEVLADLHGRRPADFHLDARMRIPTTPEEHALGELEIAEPLYDAADLSPEPVISFGRQWMRRNVPPAVDHTAFIQGDTGPGNFVFSEDKVWLVDMEICHFGDPMEDLAAVCVRDMVTPSMDLRQLFAKYDSLVPWTLDLDRVRYHRVSKCVRSLMAIVSLSELGRRPGDLLTWWGYRALYVRGACQALAEAMGLNFASFRDAGIGDTLPLSKASTPLHDLIAADLRALSDRPVEPDSRHSELIGRDIRAAEIIRLREELGPTFSAMEKAELEQLLGSHIPTLDDGLRQLDRSLRTAGPTYDEIVTLRFLTNRADRQCQLMRPAMGQMADGYFSRID